MKMLILTYTLSITKSNARGIQTLKKLSTAGDTLISTFWLWCQSGYTYCTLITRYSRLYFNVNK